MWRPPPSQSWASKPPLGLIVSPFWLGSEPLLVTASVRTWVQSEGGRVARSLAQGLLLLEDVHFFSGLTDGSLDNQWQWHTIVVVHYATFSSLFKCTCTFFLFMLVLLCYQAVQLAYVIDEQLKETAEDAEWEKALKDVVVATAKDMSRAAEAAKKKAWASEKARILAKKKLTKMDVKLGGMELKLAEAESLNLAQADDSQPQGDPLKPARRNGTMKASQTLKILWSPLSIKLSSMGSRKDRCLPYKPWECQTIPY